MSIPPTKFPKEAREPLEELLDAVQDAVLDFDEEVVEKKVPCFEAAITLMSGNVFTFGFHNPKMPHDQLPPEIEEAMKDPHAFLKNFMGIDVPPGAKVMMNTVKVPRGDMPVMPIPPAMVPTVPPVVGGAKAPQDLLDGIEQLLRHFYPEVQDKQILGMIYSPHKSATLEIGKVMETARKRDRAELARAVQEFIGKIQ